MHLFADSPTGDISPSLLDDGPQPSYLDPPEVFTDLRDGWDLLCDALHHHSENAARLILSRLPKEIPAEWAPPLCYSAIDCSLSMFAAIIERCPPIDTITYSFSHFTSQLGVGHGLVTLATALHKIAHLHLLLSLGADVNAHVPYFPTALQVASRDTSPMGKSIRDLLLQFGAV